MSTLNGQELELFRAGDYGAKGVYTNADLQQLASDYDPAKHEAPICVGHPKVNAPAFGWMKSLRAAGNILFGTPHEVAPGFDQAFAAKHFKKRSVALLRKPDGKLELRHVGFLGSWVPEVQGLADATFASDAFEVFEFSSNNPGDATMAEQQDAQRNSFIDGMMAFFNKKDGKGNEPVVIDIEAIKSAAKAEAKAEFASEFAALRAEFAATQTTGAAAATQARIDTTIAQLAAEGKYIPAFAHMGVPQIFAALAASATQEIEFGSGDHAKKVDPVQLFASFLGGLKKIIPQGVTFSAADSSLKLPAAAPENVSSVVAGSVEFAAAVNARAQEKGISFNEALAQLRNEGKSNDTYGSATSGQV